MIEHIAIGVRDLEGMRAFYERYFGAAAGAKYRNAKRGFCSYFLSLAGGARLELMQWDDSGPEPADGERRRGFIHIALSVGSKEAVDTLTARLEGDGHACLDRPRWTGDGYYESVFADPEGNLIEVTI